MTALKNFYWLAKPFWHDRRNGMAWLLLLTIIGLGLVLVQMNVWFSYWNKSFYDALAVLDTRRIYPLLGQYCLLIAASVLVAVYLDWLRKLLVLRWRQALTESLIGQWLSQHAFYRLGLEGEPDNPDQRIAEDINLLVSDSIDILRSFISAIAKIVSFVAILWMLSSTLLLPWGDGTLRIPGYLVWFSIAYALIGALCTHKIGQRLQALNYTQQQREADLRAALLRKRDHAEQIALYGGETREKQQLMRQFGDIAGNWYALMNRERMLGFFTVSYNRINSMVPLFAALPAFLGKTITLGGLMQISTAFMQVSSAMSWFVQAYDDLAKWSATVERLTQFRLAIERQHQRWTPGSSAPELSAHALHLSTPDGRPLLQDVSFRIARGSWVRLAGRSGLGKSTLLRTLGGLWPYYHGHYRQQDGRTLLLPQQPYLPADTLAASLSYPACDTATPAALVQVLHAVGLAALVPRLDEAAEWQRILSGGEQQRLSIARALLYRPDCLLLDEATSQLDDAAASMLMQCLRQHLSETTVIAVSHQSMLYGLFEREIMLAPETAQPAPNAFVTLGS